MPLKDGGNIPAQHHWREILHFRCRRQNLDRIHFGIFVSGSDILVQKKIPMRSLGLVDDDCRI